jgi:hypothetical protein
VGAFARAVTYSLHAPWVTYDRAIARAGQAGIVHLRLVVPAADAERVLQALATSPAVVNVVRVPGSVIRPAGDLVLCDVAREEVSVIVDRLRRLGLERDGSISIEAVETAISAGTRRAAVAAAGSPADAVIWEEVEARTSESAELCSASSPSCCWRH